MEGPRARNVGPFRPETGQVLAAQTVFAGLLRADQMDKFTHREKEHVHQAG